MGRSTCRAEGRFAEPGALIGSGVKNLVIMNQLVEDMDFEMFKRITMEMCEV